jgi:hypothetical protein
MPSTAGKKFLGCVGQRQEKAGWLGAVGFEV